MTDTYTPLYRGTRAEIKADRERADEWLRDQCREAVSEFTQDVRDEVEAHPTWFYMSRYHGPDVYAHQWELGISPHGHHGGLKVRLRKDGTIHADNLKAALYDWARKRITSREAANTLEVNKAMYAECQPHGFAEYLVSVKLSRKTIGRASVTVSDIEFKVGPMLCDIAGVPNVVKQLMGLRATYKAMKDENQ